MKKLNREYEKELRQIEQITDEYRTGEDQELVSVVHEMSQGIHYAGELLQRLIESHNEESKPGGMLLEDAQNWIYTWAAFTTKK